MSVARPLRFFDFTVFRSVLGQTRFVILYAAKPPGWQSEGSVLSVQGQRILHSALRVARDDKSGRGALRGSVTFVHWWSGELEVAADAEAVAGVVGKAKQRQEVFFLRTLAGTFDCVRVTQCLR